METLYLPDAFEEDDAARQVDFVQRYPFANLVSVSDGAPFVTHLPLLCVTEDGRPAKLCGHMARANPQWRHFANQSTALAIFSGPQGYVSPAWYGTPGVPTWNYAVVHIAGIVRLINDPSQTVALLEQMTSAFESPMSQPWQADYSTPRTTKLLESIVGFELDITAVTGKFKLSQNRPAADRANVIAQLSQSSRLSDQELAQFMMARPEK